MYYRHTRKKRHALKFSFIGIFLVLIGLAVFLSRDIEPVTQKIVQPLSRESAQKSN